MDDDDDVAASAFGGLGRRRGAAGRRSTTAVRASNDARGGAGLNDPRRARDLVRARVISDPPEGKVGGARRRRARDGAKEGARRRGWTDDDVGERGRGGVSRDIGGQGRCDERDVVDGLQDASDARSRRGAYKHAVFMTPDDGFIMGRRRRCITCTDARVRRVTFLDVACARAWITKAIRSPF